MIAVASIAEALGLPESAGHTAFGLISRIEDGLPVASLDKLANRLSPGDAKFRYRLVPKATYERRRLSRRLSGDEGARVARLARVWALALDVWGGEREAREFLFRPHILLEDRLPVDVAIGSEIGANLVVDVLGGLKYGVAV